MALRTLTELVERAKEKFGALEMSIVHRMGRVPVGGDSVVLACAAAHRSGRSPHAPGRWTRSNASSRSGRPRPALERLAAVAAGRFPEKYGRGRSDPAPRSPARG